MPKFLQFLENRKSTHKFLSILKIMCLLYGLCNLKCSVFHTYIFSQNSADETVILKRTVSSVALTSETTFEIETTATVLANVKLGIALVDIATFIILLGITKFASALVTATKQKLKKNKQSAKVQS